MARRGLGTSHLLRAELRGTVTGALSSHADRRRPHQACTKTSGIAVRNRPEPLYENLRNSHFGAERGVGDPRRGTGALRIGWFSTPTDPESPCGGRPYAHVRAAG